MSDARVVFDYDAEADDELTLKEGDLIRNIVKKEDGWWEGELRGRRGMFPENFVEEIKKSDTREEKALKKPDVSNETNAVAKVTFDYDAENDDELTLKEGDIVKVLNQEEEGWWKGELNGKIGVFPANFVELVKGSVSMTESQPVSVTPHQEPAVEQVETPEKRAIAIGGVGFGGLLTQDALSGIKLRSSSGAKQNHKPEKPTEVSELSKKLSIKRNPPHQHGHERPTKHSKPKERALVEFDYEGEQSDELTLHKGDILYILEKDVNEGWSKGELNGKVGLFPDNFVKLLPPEEPKKEADVSKSKDTTETALSKKTAVDEDSMDAKPSRPDFPFPKLKKPPAERPPPPHANDSSHPEFPVTLKPIPGAKPPDEITKKSEPPPLESKPTPDEKAPKLHEKPQIKKPAPVLPKKPDKPKPPADGPQKTKDQPISPPAASKKPAGAVLRHLNGPGKDPHKRFSAVTPDEVAQEAKPKRLSQGLDDSVNFNDIKSNAVLQPLTSDRPKNSAKNPPSKYVRPHSPKKTNAPELPHMSEKNIEAEWIKEAKELKKPVDKPKKPVIPESPVVRPIVSTGEPNSVKQLQDEINNLKDSVESITREFKEYVQRSEKKFEKMEKKFLDVVEDITKELDEEKKARSAVDVEVNRLRKLIKNQMSS